MGQQSGGKNRLPICLRGVGTGIMRVKKHAVNVNVNVNMEINTNELLYVVVGHS